MTGGVDLDALAAAPLTYDEVGSTYDDRLPAGYHHLRVRQQIGEGADRFESAAEVLRRWQMHRRAGLTVRAAAPEVADGVDAVLGIGVGPLRISAPVRVVRVVDEPGRRGFAYGTLPGHPECGEERFEVVLGDDGRVHAEIVAFSRPGTLLARAVGPAGRVAQRVMTGRYVRAL